MARITGQEGRRRRRGKGQVAPNVRRKEGRRLRFDLRMGEFAGVKNDRKMTTFAAHARRLTARLKIVQVKTLFLTSIQPPARELSNQDTGVNQFRVIFSTWVPQVPQHPFILLSPIPSHLHVGQVQCDRAARRTERGAAPQSESLFIFQRKIAACPNSDGYQNITEEEEEDPSTGPGGREG